MVKKIVISRFNNIAAILQNNKAQEIIFAHDNYQVNDIYLGSVYKIFASINAAFIELGTGQKSGFIHINDLKFLKKSREQVMISGQLFMNQLMMVQIIKEPTLDKGPRLTTNINLFGKYVVLMPFSNTISISRQIFDHNERSYLQSLAILLKPATMGLLIRAAAIGISEEILLQDLALLKQQWHFIQKLAIMTSSPCLLYSDKDLVKKIIWDLDLSKATVVIADSKLILRRFNYFLKKWSCQCQNHNVYLQLYENTQSIMDRFNINQAIVDALEPKVFLDEGGYLFIETYEALTVIDVNTGSFNKARNSKETILRTNCYAATEIAYQLKIRNINGIVIIDFIDMDSHRDQLQLLEHFIRVLSFDKARPEIIQLSKLGLVELTRRRRNQSLFEFFYSLTNKFLVNDAISSSTLSRDKLNKTRLIHKNINHLFFSILFNKSVLVSHKIKLVKHQFIIINPHQLCFSYFRCAILVPLIVYLDMIDNAYLYYDFD